MTAVHAREPALRSELLSESSNAANIQREWLSVSDVKQVYGIGRTTTYGLMASRQIEAVKCGQRTLISVVSLRRYIASLPPATFRQKAA